MKNKKESIALKILNEFPKRQLRYKGIPVNIFGLPFFDNGYKKKAIWNEFRRLKDKGYIEKDSEFVRITKAGQEYVKRRQESLTTFGSILPKSSPKNLIVMFDIPENKKAEREWFRFHLKKFGYLMIQRSVWVGPSPLPEGFLSYLKEIKLKKCVKTFKLARAYDFKKHFQDDEK